MSWELILSGEEIYAKKINDNGTKTTITKDGNDRPSNRDAQPGEAQKSKYLEWPCRTCGKMFNYKVDR